MTADLRSRTKQLTITFTDGREETFHVTESWIENGVLRLQCGEHLYALPLIGIRFWHREMSQ